jgi:hypothetical protein
MLKRILIISVPTAILSGLLIFVLFGNRNIYQRSNAAEAVPANAVLFIDQLDYSFFANELKVESQLWSELLGYDYFSTFDSLFQQLNYRITRMPLLNRCISKGNLSMSIHLLGKSKLSALFYVVLEAEVSPADIEDEIGSVLGPDVIINERRYESVSLKDVSFKNSGTIKGFSYVLKDGMLIAGTSSILIEDAVRTMQSEAGIYHQEGFKKVGASAGKYVMGHLYLNYPLLDHLFIPLVEDKYRSDLSSIAGLAGWGEYDIDFREEVLLLNGMTYADDTMKGWLNLFRGQSPVRLEAPSVIPSNANEFFVAGISDISLFIKNFIEELKIRGTYNEFQASEKKAVNRLGESYFMNLLQLIKDEIIWFTMEDQAINAFSEVVMLEVRSLSEARERLLRWLSVMATANSKEANNYTSSFQLDDQVSYNIYTFPEVYLPKGILSRLNKRHFAFYDNYIILSDSQNAIARTIYQNVLHKTLINELYYADLSNLISTKSNFIYFLKPSNYLERQNHLLKKRVQNFARDLIPSLGKIPGVVIQYVNQDEMLYSNISIGFSPHVKEKAHTVWESLLDSVATGKPWLVTNHNNLEKEILVQDLRSSLYLVNSTGRVLWKLRLDGPVLGEIYQVDYYNNGKLQYLFNTATGIHLIDRNGNYVERYPVKLRADATNGIALFDYDKRKEYRIFVACEDRKVYVYDLQGNIVPGWTFKNTEGIVKKPVQHFRVAEKDYIIFSDPVRTYILDRRGEERIRVREPLIVAENNLFYLDMNIAGKGPRFVTTNQSGSVIGISLSGEVEGILEHSATSGHFFRIKDINRDGQIEFLFADKNVLEVIDLKGKRLFSFKINSDIGTLPDIYQFSATDLKIGFTDAVNNKIYLINSDGSLYEGFPLEGNTRYSIGYFAGSDSRFNLVVGSHNGFLYNYSIE